MQTILDYQKYNKLQETNPIPEFAGKRLGSIFLTHCDVCDRDD